MKPRAPYYLLGVTLLVLLFIVGLRAPEHVPLSGDGDSRGSTTGGQFIENPEASEGQEPETAPESYFSPEMRHLLAWVDSGRPLSLQLGAGDAREYAFRPTRVTVDHFQISSSPTAMHPAEWRVYNGRELLGEGQLGDSVSMAVVNDAVSLAVQQDGVRYLVETDAASGELYATVLTAPLESGVQEEKSGHNCGSLACSHRKGDSLAGIRAPDTMPTAEARRVDAVLELSGAEEPELEANWVDHPYFRLGPQYDASLKDIIVLMVSGSTQTGSSNNLSSRAASYLTFAARVADTYERQLGMRYLLQEIVLIANDSGQDDIEYDDSVTPNNSNTGSDDLGALESWCDAHRPKLIYGWGHAAGWTLVEGSGGGTIGWAWVDAYGSSGSAFSVQERNYDWDVHSHELGHNVGASHTSGGVMNGSLRSNDENFFRENASTGGYSGAMDIYNYMSSVSRNDVYGPAQLRHAEELPFAIDDSVSTAASTPLTFDPLANDQTSVLFGATNVLRLVEVGQVFPKAAGVAEVIGNEIRFTPTVGFSGNVWFTYTIAGDVGNSGNGWLHAADVIVRVGGDNSNPSLSPATTLTDDVAKTDFSGPIRIKPLLNDEGSGRLWAGDVDVVSQIDGPAQSYSEDSFELVSASVLSGNGSVSLETRNMTRDSTAGSGNTGYLIYTPGADELDTVIIEYTVEDASGSQSNATVTINRVATVSVASDTIRLVETEGRVATMTFSRDAVSDTSVSETISFSLAGSASVAGSGVDLALAGFDSLNLDQLTGQITIPAGQLTASMRMTAYDDSISEGQESFSVFITQTESLLVGVDDRVELPILDSGSTGTPIISEDFDDFSEPSGIGSGSGSEWSNVSDEASPDTNWEVQSGGTSSVATGPNGDNTSGAGRYLYIEASSRFNNNAELLSPSYDLSAETQLYLQFAYHMYGSNMGDLHVDVRTDGGSWVLDVLPVLSGQQSSNADDWKEAVLDLSAYLSSATQFRFRGLTGSSYQSDICIDDLFISRPLSNEAASILVQPIGANLDVLDPLYLSVIAQGFPAPIYQWKRDGVPISGATGPVYYVANADSSHSGNYTVDVSSGVTMTSAVASVSVGGGVAPSISSQPSSVDALAGDDVAFSVVASGTPTPSYQWQRDSEDLSNGSGVSGATSATLILTGVDVDDIGSYSCVVSNVEGSVTSAVASLSVNAPPDVTLIEPSSLTVAIASDHGLVLDANVSDDGQPTPSNLTVTWSQVSGSGAAVFADANAATTTVTFTQADIYVLRLSANDGSLNTSVELQVEYGTANTGLTDEMPTSDLLGLWKLDASSGTGVIDSSANNYPDGGLTGDPVWQPEGGRLGGALLLDGDGDGVLLDAVSGVNTGGPFSSKTVSAWFKVDDKSVSSRKQVIYEEGGTTRGVNVYVYNGRLYVGGWNTPSNESDWEGTWLSSAAIENDTWHHVTLVLDSGSSSVSSNVLKMYLDGRLVASGDGSQLWNHSDANALGLINGATLFHDGDRGSNQDDEFAGCIDQVGLYARPLSPIEIASISRDNGAATIEFATFPSGAVGAVLPIEATVSDDGMPNPPGVTALDWVKRSGTGNVVFDDPEAEDTTAVFDAADTYTLRLFADDGEVEVFRDVSIEIIEPVALAYDQSWKDLAFGEGASGPSTELLADFNNDGRPNIMDYAFQIMTMTPGDEDGKLPEFVMMPDSNQVFAEIHFRRIEGGSGDIFASSGYLAGGIIYSVEASDSLIVGSWQSGSAVFEQVGPAISNGDGTETIVVRLKSPQDSVTNPQHFLRLELSEAP